MSLIKILCFLAVLNPLKILYAANLEKSEIISKQEEVLLELADEGIVESYHVLARFYADRSSRRNNYFNKSIHWHIKASQFGHATSLYNFGQYGLNFRQYENQLMGTYVEQTSAENIWRKEALILISEAAILGNDYAKVDLVMLPKILSFSYQEIDTAVSEALSRLNKGELINCSFFVCKAHAGQNVGANRLLGYQNAVTLFNQEQDRLKCRKLKHCLELMLVNVKVIDQTRIKKYETESANENLSKIKKNQRLQNEATENLTVSWDQQSDMDRHKQRIQAAKKIVDHYADEDRNKLKAKISELLEKINYHRDDANKVKLSEVMEILSQP